MYYVMHLITIGPNKMKNKLVIIAGPNGSGKSTFSLFYGNKCLFPSNIIDPDAIAKKLCPEDVSSVRVEAGRESILLRNKNLEELHSFTIETTLSGHTELELMQQAKSLGYRISLFYVAVDCLAVNMERVQQRVHSNGHGVPESDITRRRQKSLKNLEKAIKLADTVTVFDNSQNLNHRNFLKVLRIKDGKVKYLSDNLPKWFVENISHELLVKMKENNKEYKLEQARIRKECYQERLNKFNIKKVEEKNIKEVNNSIKR